MGKILLKKHVWGTFSISMIMVVAFIVCVVSAQAKKRVPTTQYKWKTYEWVDTCTARYVVVHDWNGRCGIYDLDLHKNITELEYRELSFSHVVDLEDGSRVAVFIGLRGHKKDFVSVSCTDDVVKTSMLDENMCYALDSCRTIDKNLAILCRALLENDMRKANGLYGQVFVMDSQTGHIRAWIALEDVFHSGTPIDAPLLKHQCCKDPLIPLMATYALVESNTSWNDSVDTKCGVDSIDGMLVKDDNWRKGGYGRITYLEGFKMHSKIAMLRAMETAEPVSLAHEWWNVADQPRDMDAMSIAAIYNVIGLEGNKMVVPSVNTDSVKVMPAEESSETELLVARKYKEYLKTCIQDGGVGSRWMNKKVDISGNFSSHRNCRPTLYDDNIQDMERFYAKEAFDTYNQMIFVGYLPSDNPRYTICVTMDKEGMIGHVGLISNTVNKLAEYLNNDMTCHNGDNSMIGNRLHNAQ